MLGPVCSVQDPEPGTTSKATQTGFPIEQRAGPDNSHLIPKSTSPTTGHLATQTGDYRCAMRYPKNSDHSRSPLGTEREPHMCQEYLWARTAPEAPAPSTAAVSREPHSHTGPGLPSQPSSPTPHSLRHAPQPGPEHLQPLLFRGTCS